MKARDIMTTKVVSVEPDATVGEIAALLFERRISGVPVVNDGQVIGIVSEGDLIRRQEIGTDIRDRSWWLRIFGSYDLANEYVKSHARRAADVMTPEPITVDENESLARIADIFETRRIKRVPVMRDGRLVGIVSRANLVQALAGIAAKMPEAISESDSQIRAGLAAELEGQSWWSGLMNNIVVSDGVVHFWGFYQSESDRTAARVAAENMQGVTRVVDHRVRHEDIPSDG